MADNFRAPAVPLVTADPYFSIWSMSDKLYDDCTRHWTGAAHNLLGLITIDGAVKRFMGTVYSDKRFTGDVFPVIKQTSVEILPMRTVYKFEDDKLELTLIFTSPLLLDEPDIMSRPVSYMDYTLKSKDGENHDISISVFLNSAMATAVTKDGGHTVKLIEKVNEIGIDAGRENCLSESGDFTTADWGYFNVFLPDSDNTATMVSKESRIHAKNKNCHGLDGLKIKNPVSCNSEGRYLIGITKSISLAADKPFSGYMCMGYDDYHSIEYFGTPIDAYYKHNGTSFAKACSLAIAEHDSILDRVIKRETELLSEAEKIDKNYPKLVNLAYRQSIAAHKLTYCHDKLQFFSKECASNGCIGTVDVTYPSIPLFLLYNPELVIGMIDPIMDYAESGMWPYEFAPHDLGTYPKANGQVYSAKGKNEYGETFAPAGHPEHPRDKWQFHYDWQMPVEESGNMLIITAAACDALNDFTYAKEHYALLKKWADYLVGVGYDPENQLCTDDFAGHLAHNTNLSIKLIVAIKCFGLICDRIGIESKQYHDAARNYAAEWKREAREVDHYSLAFNSKDTWSIKYNIMFDRYFGFELFGDEVIKLETEYYKTKLNKYGLPLDNRSTQAKSDWELWYAAVSEDRELMSEIVKRLCDMLEQTTDRDCFADWYDSETAHNCLFRNRTVQGGIFAPILLQRKG